MDREMHREQLISVVEKVLKRLTAQVMTPKNVSSVIRKAVGRKADRDRLENAVTKTNEEFTNTAIEEVQELIDEHDVLNLLVESDLLCLSSLPAECYRADHD
ncbi:unnamed protein product [Anisakis simplex]|uniref:SRP54_N domain-containing protein n=1 Tax=Anisakis simplex TaxID=6269 RepID=A0A0M3J8U5_ANISI|nr:unnamed protein product [Anisakis simplex]